jgi:hypothetical protein
MNIFATLRYRSVHGLLRAVSGLNYALTAKVYVGWAGGFD